MNVCQGRPENASWFPCGGRGPSTTFLVVDDPDWQFVCNKLEKMAIKPPTVLTSNFANQVVTKKCA